MKWKIWKSDRCLGRMKGSEINASEDSFRKSV